VIGEKALFPLESNGKNNGRAKITGMPIFLLPRKR
jgi:hypothetical protein